MWEGEAVAPDLWALLCQRDQLIEICPGPGPFRVVLGAPHHAMTGVEGIAGDWLNPLTGTYGRAADETTGLLALAVLRELSARGIACRLVIAAHPTDHDPNKTPGSPYWDNLLSSPPAGLILELHGAGRRRHHDLELSAGENALARALDLGRRICAGLARSGKWSLAVQRKPGSSQGVLMGIDQEETCRLQNPALRTSLLQAAGQAGIPALHLEAKRIFRQVDPGFPHAPRPTPAGWALARALAEAIVSV